MKMKFLAKLSGILMFASSLPMLAHASSFTGTGNQISVLYVSPDSDGTLRVTITIPTATTASCATTYQHLYVTSITQSEATRAALYSTLKSIRNGNKNFTVAGTGFCDSAGMEQISTINY